MTQISITRALTEVKHLNDRINRSTGMQFVGNARGKDAFKVVLGNNQSVVDVENIFKQNLQSALDLISRRDLLKRKIVESNSATKVTVAGETMSVSEAIEKKASIQYKINLLQSLRQQYQQALNVSEQHNAKLYQEIDNAVQQAYSNDKGKVDAEQYEAVAKPRLQRNEVSVIDSIKAQEVIKKIDEEISAFVSEIDFILSESNAKTLIEV